VLLFDIVFDYFYHSIRKFRLTLIWSKGKNVENKNEGVGRGTRVRVRQVSPSIYFHFQHFYLSTYVPFLFSTFIFSTFLPFDIFTFDQSRGNPYYIINIHIHSFLITLDKKNLNFLCKNSTIWWSQKWLNSYNKMYRTCDYKKMKWKRHIYDINQQNKC
jgi:hypothetical protein